MRRQREIRLHGIGRLEFEAFAAAALAEPTAVRSRIHVARRCDHVQLRMVDHQYKGPRGTFTIHDVRDDGGSLRLSGHMSWSTYTAVIVGFTLVGAFGAGVLLFGDGTGDALVLGWGSLVLFGLLATAGWLLYPKQMAFQVVQLRAALAAALVR